MNQQDRDKLLMETHATVKVLDERTTEQGKQIATIFHAASSRGKQVERNSTMIRVLCGIGGIFGAAVAGVIVKMVLT